MNCSDAPRRAERCDSFHAGRFQLIQPDGWGFRSGLDAMLLAASIPSGREGHAADLGAGAGVAGFAAASRCAGLRIRLVENDPAMADMACRSLRLPENRHLAERLSVQEADVLQSRAGREAAGLPDGGFTTVLTNPPFHPAGGRLSPDAARRGALAMPDGDFLSRWVRAAAALLATGGLFALVARPDNLPALFRACESRLGDLRVLAVHPKPNEAATRVLVHARKGSRAPLRLLPPLVLHAPDGALTDVARGIGAGDGAIDLGLG